MNLEQMTNLLVPFCREYGVNKLGVFGSYARGEAQPDSDLDLLVSFSQPTSLLTQIRIERELSERLGVKIDLLTEQAISPYLHDRITAEMKVVYPC